jgi:predicted N-formylglutamate amidohydrolase
VVGLKRDRTPRSPVVVTCEHASNAIPARYKHLGLDRAALESHLAYDLGARDVARFYAQALGAEIHEGRWSRLIVDLNRSAGHRGLVAERSFGVEIPGNRSLDDGEVTRRVRAFYEPYRRAVVQALARVVEQRGACVHLSVHSFAPEVAGKARDADVGLLFDPSRANERSFARRWAQALSGSGLRVRLNYPYRGTADGFTKNLRERFPASRYVGIELELNQALLADRPSRMHIARVTERAFAASLVTGSRP